VYLTLTNTLPVWGEIPRTAILTILSLADLEHLSNKSPSTASLLNLPFFTPNASTPDVGKRLKTKHITLTTRTASAMGKLARTFGLSSPRATPAHIEDFVAAQMSGWVISGAPLDDRTTMESLAAAFAVAVGHELGLKGVMDAFVSGVERALRERARYSGGRGRK
jgi:hypothetical protein